MNLMDSCIYILQTQGHPRIKLIFLHIWRIQSQKSNGLGLRCFHFEMYFFHQENMNVSFDIIRNPDLDWLKMAPSFCYHIA